MAEVTLKRGVTLKDNPRALVTVLGKVREWDDDLPQPLAKVGIFPTQAMDEPRLDATFLDIMG